MQDSISFGDRTKVSRSPSLTADLGYYTLMPSHIQTTHSQSSNKYITSMKELSSMCSKATVTSLKQYNLNNFDKLTDDLLIKIFSFLTTYELCSSCFLVSRRWYCLCLDSSLWKSLVITTEKCRNLNIDRGLTTILRLLSREVQPNGCELAYNSYSSNDTLITNSLNGSNLSNLPIQTITLIGCSLLTDKSLILIARKCAFKLRSLEIRACSQIFSAGLNKILLKCVNLEKLDITGCTNITLNTLQQPEHRSKIRYLDLSDCQQLDNNTLKIMLKFYGQKLIHLYLRRCTLLTDQSIKYVTTYCPLLKELSVSYCPQLTDLVCYELSVELNSKLKYLSLAKCEQITDSGLKQIARNCNKLRYLNIRGCEDISDEGIIELARGCGARLKSLDLGKCKISDNGLTNVSENCPNLRKLSVKDCYLISDAGIMLLSYYCRGLIHLNIANCDRVTSDAYHYVKKICRRCAIHHTNPQFS